jgi:hypothetical protein
MTNQQIQNVINFSKLMPKRLDYQTANFYNHLLKCSKKLTSIDTHSCNGTKYVTEDVLNDAHEKVYEKIRITLLTPKLYFYHQSDPRGVALYVSKEKLTPENYSSKGLAIY